MDEDGEIYEVDLDDNQQSDFSVSDGDNGDSLTIKPPQAFGNKERKDKKKDRHHRHKTEHRHKSSRHRSRSDHRGSNSEDRHSRDKRRHRSDKRHRGVSHDAEFGSSGRVKEKSRSRSSKRASREQRRHDVMMGGHMHEDEDDYYGVPSVDDHHSSGRGGIPPLLSDSPTDSSHHQHNYHHNLRQHHSHGHPSNQNALPSASMLSGISPKELSERDKRMERMLAAEKQKELSQREAGARRARKEEEKRAEEYVHGYGHQRMPPQRQYEHSSFAQEAYHTSPHSFISSTSSQQSSTFHHKKKKKSSSRRDDEGDDRHQQASDDIADIHIISESEEMDHEHNDREQENAVSNSPAEVPDKSSLSNEERKADKPNNKDGSDASDSGSSDSSSDSDSDDSDSSNSDDDDDEEGEEASNDNKTINKEDVNGKMRHRSGSSTPGQEGRFDDSPERSKRLSDVSPASGELGRSPSKSPTPLKEELPPYFPALMGCRSVDEFECLNRIAEGTYGVVYRAREKCNNTIVALKRLKMEKEKEGFPITSLREINTLLKGQHINIVTVREIVVGSNMDKIYIVMDYVEHDLKSLIETMKAKKQAFSLGEVKTLMVQLLRAVHHLHDNWILHRDLKTSNLLLSHKGILKVGDFGLAREYGSPLRQYTPIVVTLWYRAPELLLGTKLYSTAIDVWSVGCIFGELLGMEPMFPGKSDFDQLNRIFKELGTPSDTIWPGYSQLPVVKKTQFCDYPYNHLRERFKERLTDKGFLLMNKFLTYNPAKRFSCQEALEHEYFHSEPPNPVPPQMFPTWPAKSEHPRGITNDDYMKPPKPPSGGKNFKDLGEDDQGVAGFFLGGGVQAGPGFQLKF